MEGEERSPGFLPPEPAGPEPELRPGTTEGPPEQEDQTGQQQGWRQQQQPGWQQQQQPGWQQQQQPGWQQPQQGYGYMPPPPGWQPPPAGWQPAPSWGYYPPRPPEPDNGAAIAGFVTSLVAAALLVMSFGFLGIVSLIASPFGIHYSRKGKRAVDEGKTPKHRSLAQAGFVIGIITLVLSAIVTILGIIFVVALATDEEFRDDFEDDGGDFDSTRVRAALIAARLAVAFFS